MIDSQTRTPSRTGEILARVNSLAEAHPSHEAYWTELLRLMSSVVGGTSAQFWQHNGESLVPLVLDGAGGEWGQLEQPFVQEAFQTLLPSIGQFATETDTVPSHCCLLVPFLDHERCLGIASLVTKYEGVNRSEAHLAILSAIAERVNRGTILSNFSYSLDELAKARDARLVVDGISKHFDMKPMAYSAVNRLHNYLAVDRVSLAIKRGSKCTIKAVSNQAVFDRRSNVIRQLEKLASQVGLISEPLIFPRADQELPPALRDMVEKYFEVSNSVGIAMLPVFAEPARRKDDPEDLAATIQTDDDRKECIGVLVLEGIEQPLDFDRAKRRWDRVQGPVSSIVANSRHYDGLFLMPVWRALGSFADLYRGHTKSKAILITAAIASAFVALVAVPGDFKIRGEGMIQPIIRNHVYAEAEGTIDELRVADGDKVQPGDLLMNLKNPELGARVAEVAGKLHEAESQLQTSTMQRVMRNFKDESEERELVRNVASVEARISGLKEQLTLLKKNEAQLSIHSPIAGEVITWDVQQRLRNRPVKPGQRLVTIAVPAGGWEIELRIPDKRAGYLLNQWHVGEQHGQPVTATFVLTSDATQVYQGVVTKVASSSNEDDKDQENVVRVHVRLADDAMDKIKGAKPGTSVIGHVRCGRASIGYCKLYECFDWIQRTWFRYVA